MPQEIHVEVGSQVFWHYVPTSPINFLMFSSVYRLVILHNIPFVFTTPAHKKNQRRSTAGADFGPRSPKRK